MSDCSINSSLFLSVNLFFLINFVSESKKMIIVIYKNFKLCAQKKNTHYNSKFEEQKLEQTLTAN